MTTDCLSSQNQTKGELWQRREAFVFSVWFEDICTATSLPKSTYPGRVPWSLEAPEVTEFTVLVEGTGCWWFQTFFLRGGKSKGYSFEQYGVLDIKERAGGDYRRISGSNYNGRTLFSLATVCGRGAGAIPSSCSLQRNLCADRLKSNWNKFALMTLGTRVPQEWKRKALLLGLTSN